MQPCKSDAATKVCKVMNENFRSVVQEKERNKVVDLSKSNEIVNLSYFLKELPKWRERLPEIAKKKLTSDLRNLTNDLKQIYSPLQGGAIDFAKNYVMPKEIGLIKKSYIKYELKNVIDAVKNNEHEKVAGLMKTFLTLCKEELKEGYLRKSDLHCVLQRLETNGLAKGYTQELFDFYEEYKKTIVEAQQKRNNSSQKQEDEFSSFLLRSCICSAADEYKPELNKNQNTLLRNILNGKDFEYLNKILSTNKLYIWAIEQNRPDVMKVLTEKWLVDFLKRSDDVTNLEIEERLFFDVSRFLAFSSPARSGVTYGRSMFAYGYIKEANSIHSSATNYIDIENIRKNRNDFVRAIKGAIEKGNIEVLRQIFEFGKNRVNTNFYDEIRPYIINTITSNLKINEQSDKDGWLGLVNILDDESAKEITEFVKEEIKECLKKIDNSKDIKNHEVGGLKNFLPKLKTVLEKNQKIKIELSQDQDFKKFISIISLNNEPEYINLIDPGNLAFIIQFLDNKEVENLKDSINKLDSDRLKEFVFNLPKVIAECSVPYHPIKHAKKFYENFHGNLVSLICKIERPSRLESIFGNAEERTPFIQYFNTLRHLGRINNEGSLLSKWEPPYFKAMTRANMPVNGPEVAGDRSIKTDIAHAYPLIDNIQRFKEILERGNGNAASFLIDLEEWGKFENRAKQIDMDRDNSELVAAFSSFLQKLYDGSHADIRAKKRIEDGKDPAPLDLAKRLAPMLNAFLECSKEVQIEMLNKMRAAALGTCTERPLTSFLDLEFELTALTKIDTESDINKKLKMALKVGEKNWSYRCLKERIEQWIVHSNVANQSEGKVKDHGVSSLGQPEFANECWNQIAPELGLPTLPYTAYPLQVNQYTNRSDKEFLKTALEEIRKFMKDEAESDKNRLKDFLVQWEPWIGVLAKKFLEELGNLQEEIDKKKKEYTTEEDFNSSVSLTLLEEINELKKKREVLFREKTEGLLTREDDIWKIKPDLPASERALVKPNKTKKKTTIFQKDDGLNPWRFQRAV